MKTKEEVAAEACAAETVDAFAKMQRQMGYRDQPHLEITLRDVFTRKFLKIIRESEAQP